jgi:hypothetical protein
MSIAPAGVLVTLKRTLTPPYVGFDTVYELLDGFVQEGLPERINHQAIPRASAVVVSQIVTALKFLNLTDNLSRPTALMVDAIGAFGKDNWPDRWGKIIRSAYAPLFVLDLKAIDAAEFSLNFGREYPAAEDVQRKARAFFVRAAEEANIEISIQLQRSIRHRSKRRLNMATISPQIPNISTPVMHNVSSVVLDCFPDYSKLTGPQRKALMVTVDLLKKRGR